MSQELHPPIRFANAQEVETAFYEALANGDLDAMMAVWAEDEEIVCIHPAGTPFRGYEQVRESWRVIFMSGQRLRIMPDLQLNIDGPLTCLHSVHEWVGLAQGSTHRELVVATNVYQRGPAGWRMVVHHASPAPGGDNLPALDESRQLH